VSTPKIAPRKLSREEIADDYKQAIISLLLGQRTWSSDELDQPFTVREVAERLALRL
jgi:hypothetical protein